MKARAIVVWLAAALPPLLVGTAIRSVHQVPAQVRSQVTDLNGDWRILEGDLDESIAANPALDDTSWQTLRIPGPLSKQGFHAPDAWLRKEVTLSGPVSEELFLILGDSRASVSRVYVNGQRIGEKGVFDWGLKVDLTAAEGWTVPRAALREGRNVIAIRQRWLAMKRDWVPDGFMDRRQLIGPLNVLKPWFVKAQELDGFLRNGPVLLYAISILLMLALAIVEWSSGNRARYLQVIALVLVTGTYITLYSGLFTTWLGVSARVTLLYYVIGCLCPAFLEFFEPYYLGGPRFRRPNRFVWLGFMVLGPLVVPLRYSGAVYTLMAVWLFAGVGYQAFMTVRDVARGRNLLSPVLATAIFTVIVSGSADLFTDLGLASMPRLFQPALAAMPIVLCIVVIGDFLNVYRTKQELSSSLARTNTELAEALVGAQEATRVKSQFLANVSHELRTPLNSIINLPEGLLEEFEPTRIARCSACSALFDLEPGESLDSSAACGNCTRTGTLGEEESPRYRGEPKRSVVHLGTIRNNGLHLLRIVDQILDISKLEAGRMRLHPEDVPIAQLLEDLKAAVQSLADQRGVTLLLRETGPERRLRVDRVKIAQVLINLVANAIKFSHDQGRVTVTAVDEGDAFRFDVRDEGIGIAPEHHELIFESFRQVDGTDTRKYGGSGLGLAISRQLVSLHGGSIHLESAPGSGSTFSVRLPLRSA